MYNTSKNEWVYKKFDKAKYMSFLAKDKSLKKYNKRWDKVSYCLE